MVNETIQLGKGLTLKNPVMTASGTFGYGEEYADFIDLTSNYVYKQHRSPYASRLVEK